MAVWLVVCRSKLHQRIHAIHPGWLEEWITDWPGEEILVRLGLRLWAKNRRGIILDPLHVMVKPLAVTRLIPELEEDAGAGKT